MKEEIKASLASAGRWMPRSVKFMLAKRSPRFGHLLRGDGEFVFDEYLGSLRVKVNARNNIDREMLAGMYEPGLQRVIESQVKEGDFCVDVGANFGAIGLALSRRVGPRGKVVCFEPGPEYFERLKANFALNPRLQNMELHALGVSSTPGELFWKEDAETPGNAGLLGQKGIRVPVTSLDVFSREKNWERVSFIKIDTEGMETEVLQGAKEVLQKFRPKLVIETLMSFEKVRNRPIRKEAESFLLEMGYALFDIKDDGTLSPTQYPDFGLNTLALPR